MCFIIIKGLCHPKFVLLWNTKSDILKRVRAPLSHAVSEAPAKGKQSA